MEVLDLLLHKVNDGNSSLVLDGPCIDHELGPFSITSYPHHLSKNFLTDVLGLVAGLWDYFDGVTNSIKCIIDRISLFWP